MQYKWTAYVTLRKVNIREMIDYQFSFYMRLDIQFTQDHVLITLKQIT